jgi:site-specific recombinase XerD
MGNFKDLDVLLEQFLNYYRTNGKSENTTKNYKVDLQLFMDYIVKHQLDLKSINTQELDGFKSYMVLEYSMANGEHLKPSSINRMLIAMRQYFKYLQYIGYRQDNPALLLNTMKTHKALPEYFKLEQVRKILTSIEGENKERDTAIFFVFLMTGMRLSELTGLKLENIRDDTLRIIHGKGDKERLVSLDDQTLEILNTYLKIRGDSQSKSVFLTDRDSGISTRAVQEMVKRRLIQAGVPVMSAHKLRHTAATLMLQGGADIRVIQEALGHANIKTTTIYAHVNETQKKKAAQDTQKLIGVTI